MLELKNITKDYVTQAGVTHALRGVNIAFRQNEFVSILGPSGCGKTTLLNIVGGLDRYTTGDLLINTKSTNKYSDRDWDTYRNHSIGFVFQSYNLIMHESVVGNVELSLTIAGVSKKERRERAIEALKKVGLEEAINKKPNQLSGGQMQRVAIARALVNNPEILLADEPTGALDSDTSLQIMELLKEIAKDRLVIMVTHNPELANAYSTRIIKLQDGLVVADSDPYNEAIKKVEVANESKGRKKKSSMSFLTALNLSFRNLLSKKGRTILISFAGSIGIIGIALILGLSDGFNSYVNRVQSDALSRYPLTINRSEMSVDSFINLAGTDTSNIKAFTKDDVIYSNDILTKLLETINIGYSDNDLKTLKTYLDSAEFQEKYASHCSAIQYIYDIDLRTFTLNSEDKYEQEYPVDYGFLGKGQGGIFDDSLVMLMQESYTIYDELLDNSELINAQYDVLAGNLPQNKNEIVVVVDKYNRINDYVLYALGVKNERDDYNAIQSGGKVEQYQGSFADLLNLKYKIPLLVDCFEKDGTGIYRYMSDEAKLQTVYENAEELNVVGVIRQKESSQTTSFQGGVAYTHALTSDLISRVSASTMVQDIKEAEGNIVDNNWLLKQRIFFPEKKAILEKLGASDLTNPKSIKIYPKSFDDKTAILNMIEVYNKKAVDDGHVEHKITYTDTVGTLMSSVSVIVSSVTYVLIAFVSISLVVSSIMIGIITYVSVIERTKEIGVLRSLGASKLDVGNIFNAETLIIGCMAGAFGIGISLLLLIPINGIIYALTSIANIAFLHWYWCLALVGISMVLTLIAGLIPSSIAAKKDPVVALRTGE